MRPRSTAAPTYEYPACFWGMDSDVIAINVLRRLFFRRRIEMKADASLQLFLKTIGGPAVFQEQEFEPGAFPVLAQLFALPENLGNTLKHRNHLMRCTKALSRSAR